MFGSAPKPPPPPPPPPNPPTYASAAATSPMSQMPSIYQGLGSSILTSPMGTTEQGTVQRKTLLGQ